VPERVLLQQEMMMLTTRTPKRVQIICFRLQADRKHTITSIQLFYRPDALPAVRQQCQSTEGIYRARFRQLVCAAFDETSFQGYH